MQTHERESLDAIAQGPTFAAARPAVGGTTPANYPDTLHELPGRLRQPSAATSRATSGTGRPTQLAAYNGPRLRAIATRWRASTTSTRSRSRRRTPPAYVQAELRGRELERQHRRALRADRRRTPSPTRRSIAPTTRTRSPRPRSGRSCGIPVDHTYNDVLPSANLKIDVTDELVARFAASRTMTRARLLGARRLHRPRRRRAPSAERGTGIGRQPGPEADPLDEPRRRARVVLRASARCCRAALFYMDLDNYVGFGTRDQDLPDLQHAVPATARWCRTCSPCRSMRKGRVQGVELAYQQAINDNFGFARQLHLRGRQADFAGDERRRPAGRHVEEHLQPERLLREPNVQRARRRTRTARRSSAAWTATPPSRRTRSRTLAASLGYTINDNSRSPWTART